MKIIECSPFYNEMELLSLKLQEDKSWVDELHVSECDMTFKGNSKPYYLNGHKKIVYKKLKGKECFIKDYYGIKRKPPFFGKKNAAWKNEATQRNAACAHLDVKDDDIVILSDIDEIIDSRYSDELKQAVKKHKIITVKLHFTLFYLNLFSKNWHEVWPGSPKDYAYRVFLIEGSYFKKHKINSNKLRRDGEGGKLYNEVFCYPEIAGFHHSWLGDYKAAYDKINSYAHTVEDHGSECSNTSDIEAFIRNKISNNESIFAGHELEIRNDIRFLQSIEHNQSLNKFYI